MLIGKQKHRNLQGRARRALPKKDKTGAMWESYVLLPKSLLCITSRGLRYRFALFKDSQVSQFYTVSVKKFIVLIFSFLLFSKQCSLLKQAKKQGNTQAPMFYRIQHKERTKSKTKSQAIRISQNSIFLFYIQGHTV